MWEFCSLGLDREPSGILQKIFLPWVGIQAEWSPKTLSILKGWDFSLILWTTPPLALTLFLSSLLSHWSLNWRTETLAKIKASIKRISPLACLYALMGTSLSISWRTGPFSVIRRVWAESSLEAQSSLLGQIQKEQKLRQADLLFTIKL